eukprot:TRINITY_DN15952_c0_g1_i2.p1 TRINITY_DN15952_c0_g1~~TRINITY_DN15952_c0_g1_i2.p1  ORF type:complete len:264 (+),score=10.95 TRINITY_DN15952_c0_g1_i2:128-919(+)
MAGHTSLDAWRRQQAKVIHVCVCVCYFTLILSVSCLMQDVHRLGLKKNRTCLKFIHIPKTGGSSIELTALSHGIAWGMCDTSLRCSSQDVCPKRLPYVKLEPYKRRCCTMSDGSSCPAWHVPPSMNSLVANNYQGCKSFCVVRDPADRFRSQHVFSGKECSTSSLKRSVEELLHMPDTAEDCHFLPQVSYVGTNESGIFCDHVLKYEHLESELRALMRDYELDLGDLRHDKADRHCDAKFDDESLEILRKHYAEDYEAFGYRR